MSQTNAYKMMKAMGFLIKFKTYMERYNIPFSINQDCTEMMFKWNGSDIKLTVLYDGEIIAGERYSRSDGSIGYNISRKNAVMLTDMIEQYRLFGI